MKFICVVCELTAEVLQQLLWIACALKDAPAKEKQQWLLEVIESAPSLKNPDTVCPLPWLHISPFNPS